MSPEEYFWNPESQWKDYEHQYRNRKRYRTPLFCEMIQDAMRIFEQPTVLDIGCGHGIDGEKNLQSKIADAATKMWGVEPDTEIQNNDCFDVIYPDFMEQAPVPPNSVHVAYCSFVIEHIANPTVFFSKIHDSLVDGGIFLGMTDYRWSPFCFASQMMETLRIKNFYLNCTRGKRGVDRYENYPTYYRANSIRQIKKTAPAFRKSLYSFWHRYGELNYYLPKLMQPAGKFLDFLSLHSILPRQIFICGLQK